MRWDAHQIQLRLGQILRRRKLVTAVSTVALLGAAGVTAPMVLAEDLPQHALQVVAVDLSPDAAVTALTSSLVTRDKSGSATKEQALDPAKHAADLPVRVTTSWQHAGQVGTDLSQLKGVNGRVQINVTVQNVTARAERFQYDAAGNPRDTYELVTTPMTVVASAKLPGNVAASLVRPQPGATEPGTTNGVVSADSDATTVQWASLLAPPRLSDTTTFTLVQDAKNFQLPAISIAVQPGVTTDTSVARLVGDAFGSAEGVVGSENNTIGLLAHVNATLAQVADSLQSVQQTLTVNAGQIGEAATAQLNDTAGAVDAAAKAVLSDLKALGDSVSATVQDSNSKAVSSLEQSIQGVLDYFGTPTTGGGSTSGTCGAPLANEAPAPTLLGQLATVSRQMRQLASASGDCVTQLRDTLKSSIGSAAQCTTTNGAQPASSLVCRLLSAGTDLVGVAGNLAGQIGAIPGLMKADDVAAVSARMTALVTAVQALQKAGADLGPSLSTDNVAPLLTALDTVDSALQDAQNAVGSGPTGVTTQLAAITTTAQGQLAKLGSTTALVAQLEAVADAACVTSTDPGTGLPLPATAAQDAQRQLIDGKDCAGNVVGTGSATYPTSLVDRISGDAEAWQSVLDGTATATADLTTVTNSLADVSAKLTTLGTTITALRTGTVNAQTADAALRVQVTSLVNQLDALYSDTGAAWQCGNTPADAPALNALADSFSVVDCNQNSVASDLQSLLQSASDQVKAAGAGDVQKAADDAEAAGNSADGSLSGLSQTLATQLAQAADQQTQQGQAVVAAQTARLAAVKVAAQRDLDASAQAAVGRLAEQIASADSQQSAAAAALQAQLQKVLLDLGSATQGRGLLGAIQNSAGQTGVRTQQVEQTGQSAASFGGVRTAELADAQLEQQQYARSLQSAQQVKPFAEDLPQGSVSSTVFLFRLGQGS